MTGPAYASLEQLNAKAEELKLELEALQLRLQEEQDGADDDVDAAFLAIEDQVNAALAGMEWITAMTEAAAGATAVGLGPTVALVNALLAHVQRYIPIIETFLEGAKGLVQSIQPPPFLVEKVDETKAEANQRLTDAQADVEELRLLAEEARDGLILYAEQEAAERQESVDDNRTKVEETVRPYVEAALIELQAALESLEEEEDPDPEPEPEPEEPSPEEKMLQENITRAENEAAGAIVKLEALRADLAKMGEDNVSALQADIELLLQSIDEALAPLEFALVAIEAARQTTEEGAQIPLQYAEAQTNAAINAVEAVRNIVLDAIDEQYGPTIDAQLAQAETQLKGAADQAEGAQAELEKARGELESGLAGALEPPEEEPAEEEPPAEEPKDSEDIALCIDQPTSVVCAEYMKPGQQGSELVLVITIPNVMGLIQGLPLPEEVVFPTPSPSTPAVPTPSAGAPGGLPADPPGVPIGPPGVPIGPSGIPVVTAPDVPQPTLTQTVPPPGTQLPPLPGPTLPATSSAPASSSNAVSSPAASTSGAPTTGPAPKLGMSASPASVNLREGQQGLLTVKIKNEGERFDNVYLGAQTDAPISIDSTQDAITLEPGQTGEYVLRLTPRAPGSGTIKLVASSGNGATSSLSVPIMIANAPASSSDIVASVEPAMLDTEVGQSSIVTIRLENKGSLGEHLTLLATASGADVEPAKIEVYLGSGESAVRSIDVTPTQSGMSSVQVHLQSAGGADLKPIVVVDADEASTTQSDDDPKPVPSKGKSPGLAVPIIVIVLAGALLLVRRRNK